VGPASTGGGAPGILHVDMDAFFAAVEVMDDPSLAGVALVVGGDGARGVVASCSYEARRYGVRSAMPAVRARRQCPHAVFRAGRYERYSEVSRQIHEVFNRFTPLVEGIALDEAFLDVRGATRLLGPAPEVATAVRAAIRDDVGLTCSVGVATTKLIAKLASEAAKPSADHAGVRPGRGVVVVEAGQELAFLHPLPVEALWGVGPATSERLRALGITTVGGLAAVPVAVLERSIGGASGRHLHDLAAGIDPRPVVPDRAAKSVGHEETYARDRRDHEGLHRELVRLSDAVGTRLRRGGLVGRTVQLKVRFPDFTTITRAHTVREPIATGAAVVAVASALLAGVDVERGVRLLGVSVSNLSVSNLSVSNLSVSNLSVSDLSVSDVSLSDLREPDRAAGPVAVEQLTLGLDDEPTADGADGGGEGVVADPARWDAATAAMDAVRARYGDGALGPATLLGRDGLRIGRAGDNRWGAVGSEAAGGDDPAG
jgi:DNA polymerase-4